MSDDSRPAMSNLFTQVDITANSDANPPQAGALGSAEQTVVLREILSALDRQNELMQELLTQTTSVQKHRQMEMENWKKANPRLAQSCRSAAEALSRVQSEFLERITEEIDENQEALLDGEFMLAEFVDRFGPRLAHLNGVLQVLSQLGANPASK